MGSPELMPRVPIPECLKEHKEIIELFEELTVTRKGLLLGHLHTLHALEAAVSAQTLVQDTMRKIRRGEA